MSGLISSAARRLPVIIAGAGPAGSATAIGLRRASESATVFEARGAVATRARNIFLRGDAREILKELTGVDPGRDVTIMAIENSLRRVAHNEGVGIQYNHRILDVVERPRHLDVVVEPAGSSKYHVVPGRAFVEATGGRLEVTNSGLLERVPTTSSHVYVTAQYDSPPAHKMVYGAYDRKRDEALLFYRVDGGKGFIAYYDLPVGRSYPDEAAVLARYDALAGQLNLGKPVSPPQVFDAMQHVSRGASSGRILKIGDSAGNADPYIGAGVAAALIDSKKAVAALTAPGDVIENISGAAKDVLAGHKALGWQAEILREGRPLAMRTLPSASLDESFRASDMRVSIPLELSARAITKLPVPGT